MLLQYLQTDHKRNIFGQFFFLFGARRRLTCGRIPAATAAAASVCLQTKLSEKVK